MTPCRRRDERGAVIILMAAFSLVIVGMAALVVDVGALKDEKRQLQNGADAAALGLAQHIGLNCAMAPNTTTCSGSALRGIADSLAGANAHDSAATVDNPVVDYNLKQVTVVTKTKTGSGGTILPYAFAQGITGQKGKAVTTRAVAGWSGLKRASVVPLTFSRCEFEWATNGGVVFDVQRVVLFHGDAPYCNLGPSGADLPGGFGWLKDDNDSNRNDCNITPTAGDTVRSDSGLPGTPGACRMSTLLNQNVLLPIYDSLSKSTGYRLYGFAQFHINGFKFPTQSGGITTGCPTNACILGKFIRFVPIGELGGPSLGNRVALVS